MSGMGVEPETNLSNFEEVFKIRGRVDNRQKRSECEKKNFKSLVVELKTK
jgi:hypothetical protein